MCFFCRFLQARKDAAISSDEDAFLIPPANVIDLKTLAVKMMERMLKNVSDTDKFAIPVAGKTGLDRFVATLELLRASKKGTVKAPNTLYRDWRRVHDSRCAYRNLADRDGARVY